MNFKDYATIWITKHIPTSDIYGDTIRKCVSQFVELTIKQRHSGASLSITMSYFQRLLEDYRNQEEL